MRALEHVSCRRSQAEEFTCPHCKAGYLIVWDQTARDNGSAQCEICDKDMLRWRESFIPLIRIKLEPQEEDRLPVNHPLRERTLVMRRSA
jgi:predicted Zn finger-like uncharacterized protein